MPPSPEPECFVGMGLGNDHDGSASPGNLEDSEEVRQLVEEAFAKGQEKGRAEVAAANREKIEQAVAALKAAIEEMEKKSLPGPRARMEIETVRLALAIAKKIVRYETEHGDVIEKVVKAAMQQVADPRKLRVRSTPGISRRSRPWAINCKTARMPMRSWRWRAMKPSAGEAV